ncbi:MAG: flagellin [Candidatus Cloacimonadota bacterium]|nr:MAG: flagellin [Candidatus Cloacimonadota bacterium]
MSLYINHNLYANNSATNLQTHYANMGRSIQRLTTGLRVNSAQDDAAGLAVREEMRADIGVLDQGVRNARMAINMLHTAEGAMAVIDEKLVRMKQLAEQAATGTYTHEQRQIIHSEFAAMAAEIDRIAASTEFGGIKLINGDLSTSAYDNVTAGGWVQSGYADNTPINNLKANGEYGGNVGVKIHFGTGNNRAEDYYFINIGDMTTNGLFADVTNGANTLASRTISISTQHLAQVALEQIDTAIMAKEKNRAYIGSMMNRLDNTILSLQSQKENLQAAESQISDVDLASEMTEFTKNQVLTQSAIAMLAQANSLPQMALRLLG